MMAHLKDKFQVLIHNDETLWLKSYSKRQEERVQASTIQVHLNREYRLLKGLGQSNG